MNEFRVLGPLEVLRAGQALDLGPPKQRAVLAVLLIEANRVVPLDRLVDVLWGDEPPARATGALQVYVSGLRRVLEPLRLARSPGDVLITRPPGYLLRIEPDQLDSARFENLAALGHNLVLQARPAAARQALTEALELWRGPAFADFTFDPFAQAEAARLEELRAGVIENRIAAELGLGNHVAMTAELEALIAAHPLRERLSAQLMLALYRSERQAEALRAYDRARAVLRAELGLEPGPVLQRLRQEILLQAATLDWHPPASERPIRVTSTGRAGTAHRGGTRQPRLVGRQRELELFDIVLIGASRGFGSLVLVSGEPGIGKTRLLEALMTRASAAGFRVAPAPCHHDEGAPALWPWTEVIRGVLGDPPPDAETTLRPVAAEIAQIAPEIKELVPVAEAPAALDPASARFRLHRAVCDLLEAVARDRPLLVVLDDLHLADVASLQLAEFAAERLRHSPVVLAAAYRDVDPPIGGALADTLGSLARHALVERLLLSGLTRDEVAVLIAQATGREPPREVASVVHRRTDGNPFFVLDLARQLARAGALDTAATAAALVPPGVRDVVRRRLSRLPGRARDLLALAAVVGCHVDLRVLAAASAMSVGEVVDSVDASVAAGILVDEGAAGLRFSHPLVQETIYTELGTARAAHLQDVIAEVQHQVEGVGESRAEDRDR